MTKRSFFGGLFFQPFEFEVRFSPLIEWRAVLNVFAWLSSWWFGYQGPQAMLLGFGFFFLNWRLACFWSLVRFHRLLIVVRFPWRVFVIFFVSSKVFSPWTKRVTFLCKAGFASSLMWFCSHFFRALFSSDLGTWSTLMYLITSKTVLLNSGRIVWPGSSHSASQLIFRIFVKCSDTLTS